MRNTSKRANNALYVGNKVSDTQFEDTTHSGTSRPVQRGKCYKGNGTGYITMGNIPELNVRDFEFELWFNPKSGAATNHVFMSNSALNVSGFLLSGWYTLFLNSTQKFRIIFWIDNPSNPANSGVSVELSTVLDFDTWHKVKGVVKSTGSGPGGEVDFYLNDEFVETKSISNVWGFAAGINTEFRLMSFFRTNAPAPLPEGSQLFGASVTPTANPSDGVLYKCDENSGNIAHNSIGTNRYPGTKTNFVTTTPEQDPNSIHQYQDIYSWQNIIGYSIDNTGSYPVFVPRDESIILPPFKDVLGNDLQFIGHVPNNFDWVNSACFRGDGSGHLRYNEPNFVSGNDYRVDLTLLADELSVGTLYTICASNNLANQGYRLLFDTDGTIGFGQTRNTQYVKSDPVDRTKPIVISARFTFATGLISLNVNGTTYTTTATIINNMYSGNNPFFVLVNQPNSPNRTGPSSGVKVYSCSAYFGGSQLFEWSLSEPIIDPTSHTYFDKSGNGNHATLINGSLANYGRQDVFHDLMVNGFGIINILPIEDNQTFSSYNRNQIFPRQFTLECYIDNWKDNINRSTFIIGGVRVYWWSNLQIRLGWHTGDQVFSNDANTLVGGKYRFIVDLDAATTLDRFKIEKDGVPLTVSATGTPPASYNTTGNFQVYRTAFTREDAGLNITSGGTEILRWGDYKVSLSDINSNYTEIFYDNSGIGTKYVPTSSVDPTKDALGNPLTHTQDGKSFLDCGTELLAPRAPELIQSEAGLNVFERLLFDENGLPNPLTFEVNANDAIFIQTLAVAAANGPQIDDDNFYVIDGSTIGDSGAYIHGDGNRFINGTVIQSTNFTIYTGVYRKGTRIIDNNVQYFKLLNLDSSEVPFTVSDTATQIVVNAHQNAFNDNIIITSQAAANGFDGTHMRGDSAGTASTKFGWLLNVTATQTQVRYKFKYRSSADVNFTFPNTQTNGGQESTTVVLPANTGNAIEHQQLAISRGNGPANVLSMVVPNGEWIEISDIELEKVNIPKEIVGVFGDRIFSDVSKKDDGTIKNIRAHKSQLIRAQLDTEKRITRN